MLAGLLIVVAMGPLFIALGLADLALDTDREGDTPAIAFAFFALPFLVAGAIVAVLAGLRLHRSELFRRATRYPPVAPAIVVAALLLVIPAFLDSGSLIDDTSPARVLAATALSIALAWAAALRVRFAVTTTAVLGVVLLVAVGSVD